jgi:ubiquinone biosynthesis monooxygenase Coq7
MTDTATPLSTRRTRRRLPGDLTRAEARARMIRVDHAGEYGAVRIYDGQRAVLGKTEVGPVLDELAAHEEEHLAAFERLIAERRVRPTVMMPIWHVAGFALGAGTALMSREAAMACTVAVEEAIDEHYAAQVRELDAEAEDAAAAKDAGDGPDPEAAADRALRDTFEAFRQDEIHHKEVALAHDAEQARGYTILSKAIKRGAKAAIWLSERI